MTGRPPATDPEAGGELERAIGSVSHSITDPVAKLRYLRGALADGRAADRHLRAIPSAQLRGMLYRILSVAGLRHTIDVRSLGYRAPTETAGGRMLVLSRIAVAGAALLVAVGLVSVAYKASRPAARPVEASAPRPASPARLSPPVAEPGPELHQAKGIAPSAVWLVENGADFEQYSNGLRIDTSFAVPGPPRRYRVFEADGTFGPAVYSVPVGILFHTTESDVWPLEASFNENLRDSSHRLLKYVSRNRLYHYLIDRFGRVYRVVGEDGKANHAGHSVWAVDGRTYLNLNNAFFGVAFETRWDGGRALPSPSRSRFGAHAHRYLRHRYGIAAEMVRDPRPDQREPADATASATTSTGPGASPFEAFGLPDSTCRITPSVAGVSASATTRSS
jgi:hypothetical protein